VKLSKRFCEVARAIAGDGSIDFQCGACPDQSVGLIGDFNADSDDFPQRKPVARLDDRRCVVLIMESPHINEFIGEWGPAKGKTGKQIRKHITKIVTDPQGCLSELILINAIQYQCSLGISTDRYRDEIFYSFWQNGGKENFERRLKCLYRPMDMLFNCCTKGSSRKDLRHLVTAAIRSSLGAVSLHSGPHPCSWFCKRNRDAVRLDAD
jgi:hypothetical protein